MNFNTFDGSTVEAVRRGPTWEMILRNVKGDVTATVEMDESRAALLRSQLPDLTWLAARGNHAR